MPHGAFVFSRFSRLWSPAPFPIAPDKQHAPRSHWIDYADCPLSRPPTAYAAQGNFPARRAFLRRSRWTLSNPAHSTKP